jgi:hypothetical protein
MGEGPAAARDRAQKTLRQARAACRRTRLPAWAAAAAAALPAVVDRTPQTARAPVDQKLLEESWRICASGRSRVDTACEHEPQFEAHAFRRTRFQVFGLVPVLCE